MYIGETGQRGIIRINDHKPNFDMENLNFEFVIQTLNFDLLPDFDNIKLLTSGIN